MSRGIFSLNESYNEQISGDWSTASDVWLIGSPVTVGEGDSGYFIGGNFKSLTQRVDYSNDTQNLVTVAPLTPPICSATTEVENVNLSLSSI